MEILSENSFKTRNHVKVTCSIRHDGAAYLRFEGLYSVHLRSSSNGEDWPVSFHPDEREAMQTLLAGGKLEVKPKFHKGDIVRFFPSRNTDPWSAYTAHAAQQGSLAVVTQGYDGGEYLYVRWICTRSGEQMDGKYFPKCFDVVTENELTYTDKQEILNHTLRG